MGIYGRPVLGQAVAAALEPKLTHSIHAYFLQHHECLRSPIWSRLESR
jgi:acyl-CoA thioesterase